jgi:hypothetical protein
MASVWDIGGDDAWDSPLSSYASASEAAQVYAALAELLPGTCKAQDYGRLVYAGCQLNAQPGMPRGQLLALDVRRDLERAWVRAQELLGHEAGVQAGRLWRVWWAVRVELMSLRAVPDVSKSSAQRIVALVDRLVLKVLDELELRRLSVSEAEERRINSLDPRQVRTCMIVYEEDADEQG